MGKMTATLALDLLPPADADELRQIEKRLNKITDESLDLYQRKWALLESVKPIGERQRYKPKEELK